jgi:4-hydroxybenzoyl-CoA thioesterase
VIGVPMVSLAADYRKVLKCGDYASIETVVPEIGRSSIKFVHRVLLEGELAIEGRETRVHAGRGEDGAIKALPVPDDLRAALMEA